jgi:colanic acid/amylovoran biosynthesis protein
MMPHELRFILGKGHLTISSRMHAALSTFQMRKPAIALGYSVKYEGVIGRSVRCPELVVSSSAKLLTDPLRFSFEVLAKTNYIEEHYQQLIAHLETRIPQLKIIAEDQIREICLAANK